MPELDAIVVIPARDEAERVAACIAALAGQTVSRDRFALIVVLDRCRDNTGRIAIDTAVAHGLSISVVPGADPGTGAARRTGMELACTRLLAAGRGDGLIACTDADTRPAPDWLERQLAHVAAGAQAIAGSIQLDPQEAAALPDGVLQRRSREAAERLARVRRREPGAAHHHFGGASLGVRAETYRAVGGLTPVPTLEDAEFAVRLAAHDVPILRPNDVVVSTSARPDGRAQRGLSADLAIAVWFARRRLAADEFTLERLAVAKADTRVTVIIPIKECAATIADVLKRTVGPAHAAGLVDDVVVIDAASRDGSARIARSVGARVLQQDETVPQLGPALGKGDAMWRALLATDGDLVCFLDGDTRDPHPAHLTGLLGPLLTDPTIELVKGAFDRPFRAGPVALPHEGGRVTELMARPLINLCEPRLAGFAQPLAGEFAARREVLEALPFPVGYGVEIAILIDACRRYGLGALAECHLGTRQNRHQPLAALSEMASAVLEAVDRRCEPDRDRTASEERPAAKAFRLTTQSESAALAAVRARCRETV